ncbi:TonB-dependent receptor [Flavobacterium sp. ASW18X]|uniref:TonB-dependent receptor n=1 Tax=Flavobacterium sp. ASW18X TaxID=2572595 RepID=UPI0010AE9732|nr:TonB-dependent receptor [Flavobacterium sp. ASW18X]TKD65320.1 TonB-dependent receptor [Flavobacterium sp. ASW18X]
MKQLLYFLTILLFNFTAQAQEITVSGRVVDDTGLPVPGANVILKGTTQGTTTDFEGNYSIGVPTTGVLVFSGLGFETKSVPIANKKTINVTLATSAQQLAEAIVVGTRGQARTKLETTAPVDVISISKQQINMPQLDVAQMLVASAPSFTAVRSQGGDLSTAVNPPQLRGLGPNQLLVLVNGKRRHSGAQLIGSATGSAANSVDMDFIPTDAIDRIEVLRDGASAQYGSDAIAGVINLVTKKGTNKFTANYSLGFYTNNNPDLSDSNLSESDQALLEDTDGLDGFTHQLGANYGIGFENGGYFNITGLYRQNEAAIRPNISGATPYGSSYLNNERTDAQGNIIITNPELLAAQAAGNDALAAELRTDAGLLAARGLTARDISTFAGLSASVLGTVAYNLEIPLSSASESNFYSFGDFGYKNTDGFGCFYRRSAQTDRFSYDLYPNGFRPQMIITQTNLGLTAGVDGKLGDWDFDFSNTFGTNKQNYGQFNTFNASLGAESPTEMDLGTHSFTQNTLNFDLSRYFPEFLAGLNIAMGAEVRIENYVIERGQPESFAAGDEGVFYAAEDDQLLIGPDGFPLEDLSGNPIVDENGNPLVLSTADASSYPVLQYSPNCQCFRGFAPENEANEFRSVTGLYFDAELDVTDNWLLSGALRTEQYSDFGGVFTGKLATRYSITDDLAIRGSFSNGFRAPSLQELNYSHTFTFFVDLDPFDGTLYPNNSAVAKAIGIGQLEEERSTNVSLGITAKLFKKLDLSIDAYSISIKDRLFSTGNFSAADAPVLEPLIGSGLASFRINGGDVSTKGVEIVANYNDRVGEGMLNLNLSAIFSERTFDGANVPDLNTNLSDQELEDLYIDRAVIGSFEKGVPNTNFIATATYSFGKWSAMLRGNYIGEISRLDDGLGTLTDVNFPNVGEQGYSDQTFSAQFTTDLGITFAASKNLSFTLTGQNIFNNYPDLYRAEERGFYLYGNGQQGSLGANYLVRATLSL